jgi:hypothetical protein
MSEQTHVVTADPLPSPVIPRHDRCSACGVPLAADQRYCVECGQRCGAPRLPFAEDLVRSAQQAPGSPPRGRRRPGWSVNSTVIAGIGTLLLAMGIGVLIGQSGAGSSSVESAARPSVQIVTVPSGGAAGATATSGEPATSTSPQSSTSTGSTKSAGAAKGAAVTKSAGAATKQAAAPPAKTVKVGSAGKGPGYQKGHFTGNFFGE